MEVLTPSEIICLSTNETDSILNEIEVPIVIPKSEKEEKVPHGALFQKECATCQAPSKYQCPKCCILSCSLECVQKHKEEKNCDGIKEKTAFIHLDDYNDAHMQSDFHFLEDIQRNICHSQKSRKGLGLTHGLLPHNLYRLQVAARDRKTKLQILPLKFSKRMKSTTFLRYSDRKIFWRLEWEFLNADFYCCDERVDEESILFNCVDKYINQVLPDRNEKLSYYFQLDAQDLAVLLRDENCPANVTQYHLLDLSKTLKFNFRHKKIIEFPTLIVISKIHLPSFEIVD